GSLEAVPGSVIQPAVIGARDAALLDSAVEQRSASVGAVVLDEPDVPTLVLEEHQVLAQHADKLRRILVRQLLGDGDRMPVAPQQLTRRRAGADLRQHLVLFLRQRHASTSCQACSVKRRIAWSGRRDGAASSSPRANNFGRELLM